MRRTSIALALVTTLTTILSHVSIQPAKGVELQDLLSGQEAPLSVQLRQLDNSWRKIAISGQFEIGELMQTYSQLFGGSQTGAYYTQGRTVVVGGETYLIAYRQPAANTPVSFTTLLEGAFGGVGADCSASETTRLVAETPLTLALLNLRTIGSINQVAAFDLNTTLAESEKAYAAAKATCEQLQAEQVAVEASDELWVLGYALLLYTEENDDTLPPMTTPAAAQEALFEWVGDREVFVYSQTAAPYQPNSSLSGKKLSAIANPEEVVAFYEAQPRADGSRMVVYLDGAVGQVADSEWSGVKQVSGLP
ncbi:MAG: hypothetical protein HC835_22065 [Oscillatoriales cyanobacterium RM2_1_1]|nr:hypothetical protein [Oscillatoriales cyanobacterium SM2_3_0]NJO48059.1 hypothetical protein [Oscillatoriales cyanobacterium RM2_1_1]